jgi:hypothetical protein
MEKDIYQLAEKQRLLAYKNPDSISKEYDAFLEKNNIYHSLNRKLFEKSLHGHIELCDGILDIYKKTSLENEKISLLEDLFVIGYDRNALVELILLVFKSQNRPSNLWEYGDLLYKIGNFNYLHDYLELVKDKSLGSDRQMLLLLLGKSKNKTVIPVLIELLSDNSVCGHALDALSNFSGNEIEESMLKYSKSDITWVRNIAKRYLDKTKKDN